MRRRVRIREVGAVAFALSLAGCSAPADTPAREAATADAAPRDAAVRTVSGIRVVLEPRPTTLDTGSSTLRISLSPLPDEHVPVTVDLASPTMPSHGVMRTTAVRRGDAYEAPVRIPMAGAWALYVNVGSDTDVAEFLFDVAGDSTAHGHAGHGALRH